MRLSNLCLFFGFFLLRFWGIQFGLPLDGIHPTEHFSIEHSLKYLTTADFKPLDFQHPTLYQYLITLFAYLLHLPLASPAYFYLLGRIISCLASSFAVWLLYLLAKEFLASETFALLAASFMGLNLLAVQYAHYAVPDSLSLLFVVATALFAAKARQNASLKNCLLAGVFCGLSVGAKFTGLIALIFLFFIPKRRIIPALLVAFCAFFLASPFHILYFNEARLDFSGYLTEKGYPATGGFSVSGFFNYPLALLPNILGVLGYLTALFGIIIMFLKEKRKAFFLFAPAFLYLLFIGKEQGATLQNILPLLPILSIFCAYALFYFDERKINRPLLIGLAASALIAPLAKSLIFDIFVLRPDTRVLAQEWFMENAPEKSRIAFERYGPFDLNYLTGSKSAQKPGAVYFMPTVGLYPAHFYQLQGYDYLVTSGFREDNYAFFCRSKKDCRETENYATYKKQFELAAAFEPPAIFKFIAAPFPWGTWPHKPVIKIYKIK